MSFLFLKYSEDRDKCKINGGAGSLYLAGGGDLLYFDPLHVNLSADVKMAFVWS
jgi:hypothetical protein